MKINTLRFGTAGTPICCKDRGSLAGVETVRKLGLDCMELEFVRGVRMSPQLAEDVGKAAKKNDVILTAHGPYYINLNSVEAIKVKQSVQRILQTARIADKAGAYSITFHAAFYMKQDPEKVYQKVKAQMKSILKTLKDQGIDIWVRPETTGKPTQWGSIDEIIRLSKELEHVLPCIDFAHLHARTGGKMNSESEFRDVMAKVEKALGRTGLNNMHIHMSGIAYSDKGEQHHLVLRESDLRYKDVLKVLKEFRVNGVVISESPNIEDDALLMKKFYSSL
jgi:deoxyribonuclease-4